MPRWRGKSRGSLRASSLQGATRPIPFLVWAALAAAVAPTGGLSFVPAPAPLGRAAVPSCRSGSSCGWRRGRVALMDIVSRIGSAKEFGGEFLADGGWQQRKPGQRHLSGGKGETFRRGDQQRTMSLHPRSFVLGYESSQSTLDAPGQDIGLRGEDMEGQASASSHGSRSSGDRLEGGAGQGGVNGFTGVPGVNGAYGGVGHRAGHGVGYVNGHGMMDAAGHPQAHSGHSGGSADSGQSSEAGGWGGGVVESDEGVIDDDSTSVQFLGGWAETFPSMVQDSRVDSPTPVRIPFLLGKHRGARPAMAILAPPESMTLYKRIPFLTGTRRPPSQDDKCVSMGEDAMSASQKAASNEKAQRKAAAAKLSFFVWRTKKGSEQTERRRSSVTIESAPKRGAHDVSFDGASVGEGLAVEGGGLTIRKTDGVSTPAYAVWSKAYDSGVTSWALRVDVQTGIMFVGCLIEPYSPSHGFARSLGTKAWMLGSYGYVCRTGPNGQEALTQEVKEQLGDCRQGILSFKTGSIVRMTLDRDERTLKMQVNDLPAFTLHGVSARARPFVNMVMEGDTVSLIPENGGGGAGVQGEMGAAASPEKIKRAPELSEDQLWRIREEADRFWS